MDVMVEGTATCDGWKDKENLARDSLTESVDSEIM